MDKKPLPQSIKDRYNTLSDRVEKARKDSLSGNTTKAILAIQDLVAINNDMQKFILDLINENYQR